MTPRFDRVLMSECTTMRVGGPVEVSRPTTEDELVQTALAIWESQDRWFVLGGGSNLLVSDDGFDGKVLQPATHGIDIAADQADPALALVTVAAGERWDHVVATLVAAGLQGVESLSGIPGDAGAAIVQNIGAYGHEIGEVIESVRVLDFESRSIETLSVADLELGYRDSVFKHGRIGVILELVLRLRRDPNSLPVAYVQLARALEVAVGDRVPLHALRDAVLRLRATKGMVLDASDPDTASCGSFFTNPIVHAGFATALPPDAPRFPIAAPSLGAGSGADARHAAFVKLSAAWLIDHAGIHKGFALPGSRAAISSKHTLAITNRGGASAFEVVQLAGFVQTRVANEFGVQLQPEPNLIGLEL